MLKILVDSKLLGIQKLFLNYLKLNNKRNPVVYLMEAADDIAYSAADI